jgi:hypothetical protein
MRLYFYLLFSTNQENFGTLPYYATQFILKGLKKKMLRLALILISELDSLLRLPRIKV